MKGRENWKCKGAAARLPPPIAAIPQNALAQRLNMAAKSSTSSTRREKKTVVRGMDSKKGMEGETGGVGLRKTGGLPGEDPRRNIFPCLTTDYESQGGGSQEDARDPLKSTPVRLGAVRDSKDLKDNSARGGGSPRGSKERGFEGRCLN